MRVFDKLSNVTTITDSTRCGIAVAQLICDSTSCRLSLSRPMEVTSMLSYAMPLTVAVGLLLAAVSIANADDPHSTSGAWVPVAGWLRDRVEGAREWWRARRMSR